MDLGKLKPVRVELAVCILGPLVVLAAILVPGRLYCRHLGQVVAERKAGLEQAPKLETQLAEARAVVTPLVTGGAEGDRPSELTLMAEKAAQAAGFSTRSVNVTKMGEGTGWVDYRIAIQGGGPMKSVVALLDTFDEPSRRARTGGVSLRAGGFGPGVPFDGEITVVSRTIAPAATSGAFVAGRPVTAAQAAGQADRLRQLTAAIKTWADQPRAPLVMPTPVVTKPAGAMEHSETTVPFKLNGIARDKRNPLALTDRGVLGVGDQIDGYTVREVEEDHVVVTGPDGKPQKVGM